MTICDHLNNSLVIKILRILYFKIYSIQFLYSFDRKKLNWEWNSIHFNRIALVNLIASKYKICNYLEIGCANNALFDSVIAKNKTGVDPSKGGTHRLTSDIFFKSNKKKFDLIFIDGLHTYDQARKDLINSIRFLRPNGWIVMHDFLPKSWEEQHVPIITTKIWTGDVWKLSYELKETKGIDFIISIIDHGVSVIKITNKKEARLKLKEKFDKCSYTYYYKNLNQLPLLNWEKTRNWITSKT